MKSPHQRQQLYIFLVALAAVLILPTAISARALEQVQKVDTSFLQGVDHIAFSPDGRHAYVGSLESAVFEHDATTGSFRFVETFGRVLEGGLGTAGPVAISADGMNVYIIFYEDFLYSTHTTLDGYRRNAGSGKLELVEVHQDEFRDIVISADGRHVYAVVYNGLVVFERAPASGVLTELARYDNDNTGLGIFLGAMDVEVSADGRHVYLASAFNDVVTLFGRDPETGALSFIEKYFNGQNGVDGLDGVNAIELSAGGHHVYCISGYADNALVVFARDPGSGALSFVEATTMGIGDVEELDSPRTLVASTDGLNLYVTTVEDVLDPIFTVGVFARDPESGTASFLEAHETDARGMNLSISPDGRYVHASGGHAGGIFTYSRQLTTGELGFESEFSGATMGFADGRSAVMSRDGRHLYVASWFDDAVSAFVRDPISGTLTFLEAHFNDQYGVVGLNGSTSATLSPDGRHLYVGSSLDRAIAVFARDAATGSLDFLESYFDVPGEVSNLGIVVEMSPDGAYVYAGASGNRAIAVFFRDPATGGLSFVESYFDGENGADHLNLLSALAMAPDGRHLYAVSGPHDYAVTVFSRNASTGGLTFVEDHVDGEGAVQGLRGSRNSLDVAPNGRFVYLAGTDDNALVVFARNSSDGTLRFLGALFDHRAGASGLEFPQSVTVSPDSHEVWVTSFDNHSVTAFAWDSALGIFDITESYENRVGGVEGLAYPRSATFSPDGKFLYVTTTQGKIVVFSRTESSCLSEPTSICLQDNRFRAEIEVRDFGDTTTLARAVPFGSDDSGLFWFFSSDNWEMLVKVLDGCSINERFWVFAAATTNVGYTLRVTDTLTGAIEEYSNTLGISPPAITDTDAFATCGVHAAPDLGSANQDGFGVELNEADSSPELAVSPSVSMRNGLQKSSTCRPSPTQLCLNDGRFGVSVEWGDFVGATGLGRMASAGSDDSGVVWFFDDQNWELLVKVLDGCAINGHYWVFSAATTNVAYTLRVTDFEFDSSKQYSNPLGLAAAAVTDTSAFSICP